MNDSHDGHDDPDHTGNGNDDRDDAGRTAGAADDGSLLTFPADFPIKAMGLNAPDFQQLVIDLVRAHAPDLDLARVNARESRGGRYLSITVTVRATSRDQLDAIYRSLTGHRRVVMAL